MTPKFFASNTVGSSSNPIFNDGKPFCCVNTTVIIPSTITSLQKIRFFLVPAVNSPGGILVVIFGRYVKLSPSNLYPVSDKNFDSLILDYHYNSKPLPYPSLSMQNLYPVPDETQRYVYPAHSQKVSKPYSEQRHIPGEQIWGRIVL